MSDEKSFIKFTVGDPFSYDSVRSATLPDFTTKEDIEDSIADYDKKRLFSDKVLMTLLQDKIIEESEKIAKEEEEERKREKRKAIDKFINSIEKIIYSGNKTIVFWSDGTKTIVSCHPDDDFDKEKGLALCIIKHLFGDIGYYNEIFKAFELTNPKKNEFKKTEKANVKARKAYFDYFKRILGL